MSAAPHAVHRRRRWRGLLTGAVLLAARTAAAGAPHAAIAAGGVAVVTDAAPAGGASDTLRFAPIGDDSTVAEPARPSPRGHHEHPMVDEWRRPPRGDRLLTDLVEWRRRVGPGSRTLILADYNRVDPLRLGVNLEGGPTRGFGPRGAVRYEYAFGRQRGLYGAEIEQPLTANGRLVAGATAARRTDHLDLQQTEDAENSLALLFARQDYRDYFEREGGEVFVRMRVPRFSSMSLHWQGYQWRSLPVRRSTRSWFDLERPLRDNPPIDDGGSRAVLVRFERLARRTAAERPGVYHWVELERAGGGLGGAFTYTRSLADLRGVVRLSPASTLALRALAGSTLAGRLPAQKEFTLGGVDGLRAHAIGAFRGNQAALAQAEFTVGLWQVATPWFESGLHAIAFVDAGRAWRGPDHWDAARQPMAADGGLGLSTAEDNLRVYVARDLQAKRARALVSLRLQRPF